MAMFPIGSNFEGDFVIQLVAVDDDSTMDQVAATCAEHSLNRRVAPRPDKILRVRRHADQEIFPRDMRLKDAGVMPTETLDVIFADQ